MDDRAEFITTLRSNLEHLGLQLDDAAVAQMWAHFRLLIAANRTINLTRITDPAEGAASHYADSLAVAAWCRATAAEGTTVLDIGTGGGFPAVPLAICRPDWQVTAIDGTGKKIRCLEQFVDQLGLTNCRALHRRAEEWREGAPSFDMVLFRAIAPLADCLGLAKRFCRPGTVVICYKGDPLPNKEAETALRSRSARRFGLRQDWSYTLKGPSGVLSRQLCCHLAAQEQGPSADACVPDA